MFKEFLAMRPESYKDIYEFELALFDIVGSDLRCIATANCPGSKFLPTKGGITQGGIMRMQVQCSPHNGGCSKRTRIEKFLQSEALKVRHALALNHFTKKGLNSQANGKDKTESSKGKKQMKLSFAVADPPTFGGKRKADDAAEDDPMPAPVQNLEYWTRRAEMAEEQVRMMAGLKEQFENLEKFVKDKLGQPAAVAPAAPNAGHNQARNTAPANAPQAEADGRPQGQDQAAPTYANKAQGATTKHIQRMGRSLFKPKQEPAQFEKVVIKMTDTRALKKAKNAKEITAIIQQSLKALGIRNDVFRVSKIGNGIMELYVLKH